MIVLGFTQRLYLINCFARNIAVWSWTLSGHLNFYECPIIVRRFASRYVRALRWASWWRLYGTVTEGVSEMLNNWIGYFSLVSDQ